MGDTNTDIANKIFDILGLEKDVPVVKGTPYIGYGLSNIPPRVDITQNKEIRKELIVADKKASEEMRMCLVCGIKHTIDKFGVDRGSADGIANICLEKKYEKKNQRRMLAPKTPVGATKSILVNFDKCGCPELYDIISGNAKDELRSPEGQVIIMLKKYLQSCSAA